MKLYRNPEFIKKEPLYRTWLDLFIGNQDTLRSSTYLFTHELEKLAEGRTLRTIREARTHYTNFIEPLVGIWTSLFFRKDPTIPEDVQTLLGDDIKNIDGNGNSLVAFMRDAIARNYFIYGVPIIRVNALGQKPETKGQESLGTFKPYFEILNPLDVPDWEIEEYDPRTLGKIKFLRFEYIAQAPRASAEDEPAPQVMSKQLYLKDNVLHIQKYKLQKDAKPRSNDSSTTDSREWEADGAPEVFADWKEVPVAALFDGESWIKDIAPQALKYHNLESVLDNIHLFQAHQRVQAIGDNIDLKEVGFSEYCISTWPLGTTFHTLEPTDTSAIEKRLLQVKDNLFKIALNQVKQLSSDSAGVQSADTMREEKEYTLALIQSEIESIENITNKAVNLYAKYKGNDSFDSQIKLNKDISESDLDQMSKAFLIIRDDIAKVPSLKKAAVKRFAQELDLPDDEITEINNDIDKAFENVQASDAPIIEPNI